MKFVMPPLLINLTAVLVPFALIGLAMRLLLTPAFYLIEYRMPYFPPDDYGFSSADRLHWAPYAVQYLMSSADISYLGNLKFDNGSALYNERELSHMQDVKRVLQNALTVWYITVIALLALAVFSRWSALTNEFLFGLRRGGWITIWLIGGLGLIVGIGSLLNPDVFWQFFTLFHKIFFRGDTWLFLYSDTLIRLFPIRFWEDVFLAAGVISLAGAAGLAFGLRHIGT